MTFVHEDPEFVALLTGIAAALVEEDYWITHSLWALHEKWTTFVSQASVTSEPTSSAAARR